MNERGSSYEGQPPDGSPPIKEHRLALVIGNARYTHAGTLRNPGNDAIGMERALRAFGFDVIGGEQDGIDLNYGALAERIRDFSRRLRQTNPQVALLFYAGHGLQVDGRNYIMPVDATLEMQSDVGSELFELQRILNEMENPSRTSLVFLDACRNNPLVQNLAQAMGLEARDARLGEGLAEQKVAAGTLIAYATQPGHIAYDGSGDNGFLTDALLTEISTAPERDIELLLRDVRVRVLNATHGLSRGPQVPWVHTSLLGAFAFQPGQKTSTEVPPATDTSGSSPADGMLAWSQTQWEQLKDTTDIGRLQRFAEHAHPFYSGEAHDRIAQLQIEERQRQEKADHEREAAKRARQEVAERKRQAESQTERYRAEGRIKIESLLIHGAPDGWFKPGNGQTEWFKDLDAGPEMVVVPAGSFTMGSPSGELERKLNEGPEHDVSIAKPFAVARCAVTFDEWDAFVENAGGKLHKPADQSWGRNRRPVINVSWDDAQTYIAWLSDNTKQPYRLLSEAEWEYVARAGKNTPFWWGNSVTPEQANYNGNYTYESGGSKGEYRRKTVPVDSFKANPWGLYNVHGNVWEWCEDVWQDNYKGAPADGSVWLESGDKDFRVVRGGSWDYDPGYLRSAFRDGSPSGSRDYSVGFRLARTLNP